MPKSIYIWLRDHQFESPLALWIVVALSIANFFLTPMDPAIKALSIASMCGYIFLLKDSPYTKDALMYLTLPVAYIISMITTEYLI